jgi:internalin A
MKTRRRKPSPKPKSRPVRAFTPQRNSKPTRTPDPPLLFISYAHVNNSCRERVRIHLTPLVRGNVLRVFDDTMLNRDEGWRKQLIKKLREAHLVLLLVSADFLYSQFCFEEEWPIARDRWKAKKAIVTFSLLHPCGWKETDIGELQGTPKHGELCPEDERGMATFWDKVMHNLRDDAKKIAAKC